MIVDNRETEDQGDDDSEDAQSPVSAMSDEARGTLENLSEGTSFSILGVELPLRALLAIALFLVAFMLVWMMLWAALGGLGLALGWIVAAAVGAAAVKLYGDRA